MDAVEIIAVIFAIVVLVKLVFIPFLKPKPLAKLIKSVYGNKIVMPIVFILLAGIIVNYLVIDRLAPAQIFTAMILGILVYGLALIMYPEELVKLMTGIMKNKKRLWTSCIIWAVFSVWVLYSIFG